MGLKDETKTMTGPCYPSQDEALSGQCADARLAFVVTSRQGVERRSGQPLSDTGEGKMYNRHIVDFLLRPTPRIRTRTIGILSLG